MKTWLSIAKLSQPLGSIDKAQKADETQKRLICNMRLLILGAVFILSTTFQYCDSGASPAVIPPIPANRPLFRDFMGINGHLYFKPELYRQVCRLGRNYHSIDWDVNEAGDSITIPVTANPINWKTDVYGPWKQNGFETDICLLFGKFGEGDPNLKDVWK